MNVVSDDLSFLGRVGRVLLTAMRMKPAAFVTVTKIHPSVPWLDQLRGNGNPDNTKSKFEKVDYMVVIWCIHPRPFPSCLSCTINCYPLVPVASGTGNITAATGGVCCRGPRCENNEVMCGGELLGGNRIREILCGAARIIGCLSLLQYSPRCTQDQIS